MPEKRSASGPYHGITPLLIAIAGVIAYANSTETPFLLDDESSILNNPTIRALSPEVLRPPGGEGRTVEGRPLVNVTLALNYALGRYEVRAYHYTNLLIHLAAGLMLYGLLRRVLVQPAALDRQAAADNVALAAALLWTLHPLNTVAVTYIIQRAEALMALCYLSTLYCLVRSAAVRRAEGWAFGAIGLCAAGMASKEVMVTAPLVALALDRLFLAADWRTLWRQRGWVHGGLAATWLLLALLVGGRGGTAGLTADVGVVDYLRTQGVAVWLYLQRVVWPAPLIFDYGRFIVGTGLWVLLAGTATLTGIIALGVWFWRRPRQAFLPAVALVILLPTTSVVPIATQTVAEHRMYLPLAALLSGLVLVARLALRQLPAPLPARAGLALTLAAAVALGTLTHLRNRDFADPQAIWADTAAKQPSNARAWMNWGNALGLARDFDGAITKLKQAVVLDPTRPKAHYNLGLAFARSGQPSAALPHYDRAIELAPDYTSAWINRGQARIELADYDGAIVDLTRALELDPRPLAYHNRGVAHLSRGDLDAAHADLTAAITQQPGLALAHLARAEVNLRRDDRDSARQDARNAAALGLKIPAHLAAALERSAPSP